jgi:hypothetical protein
MPQRRKPPKTWVYSPPKPPKAKPPEATKIAVETKASALIESVLKPAHVEPPPAESQFNYIVDIYGKWYRSYFQGDSKVACQGRAGVRMSRCSARWT